MKLAAIYNVWADSRELLKKSIENIQPVVDGVFVVYTQRSNFGEDYEWDVRKYVTPECVLHEYNPRVVKMAYVMENEKRNIGIALARNAGFTHFIIMDADEFYFQEDVKLYRSYIHEHGLNALVANTLLYFGNPTLTIGYDTTLVPFICKMTRDVSLVLDTKAFPFAYIDGQPRIDPTRRPSFTDKVQRVNVNMHHYSWVRRDPHLKIRNSSARKNLMRSDILKDLASAQPNSYCSFYGKHLFSVPNYFNL